MNLNVSGHHVAVTPAMRSYVEGKLTRINRHFDHVIDVNIILSIEKLQQKAEVTVHVSGKDIHVASQDTDLYAAIDSLVDKLDRSILKHKESLRAHPHQSLKHSQQEE
jgi:putative sigma-54 modulation protein